jgi:hypothetical protein
LIVKLSTPQADVVPSLLALPLYVTCHLHVPTSLATKLVLVVE